MSAPDDGLQHVPGYCPRPDTPAEQAAVPNLPAKSGLAGTALPPAAMFPNSCCPPPVPEPLVAMDPDARATLARECDTCTLTLCASHTAHHGSSMMLPFFGIWWRLSGHNVSMTNSKHMLALHRQ
jgi:hypothetical protein